MFQYVSVSAQENIPNHWHQMASRCIAQALAISGSLGTTREWQKDAVLHLQHAKKAC